MADEDRQKIRDIEAEVETKSLLGLGRVINAGVQGVLECDWIYVGLTNMDFDWACQLQSADEKGG